MKIKRAVYTNKYWNYLCLGRKAQIILRVKEKEKNIRNVLILIVILCTDFWENMAPKKGKIQYI